MKNIHIKLSIVKILHQDEFELFNYSSLINLVLLKISCMQFNNTCEQEFKLKQSLLWSMQSLCACIIQMFFEVLLQLQITSINSLVIKIYFLAPRIPSNAFF